ncbi:hypothetical protein [Methylocucumis oryzae]|nr:hypothetical protein [Methylocucumis oryzae]
MKNSASASPRDMGKQPMFDSFFQGEISGNYQATDFGVPTQFREVIVG